MRGNDKYYLALSNLCIQNPLFKAKLFEFFNFDPKKTFEAASEDLKNAYDFFEGDISIPRSFLPDRDKINPDKVLEDFEAVTEKGVKFFTYEDSKYPENLKNIKDFPLSLYYKGSFEDINFKRTVAFVGSRKASNGAKEALHGIISEFKGLDIVIVSGLAEGIDAKSHNSALENGLKTIGVIGSGFKFRYPSTNEKLYREMEKEGLILSEYPYEMPPLPFQFPQRNRIVTGMSYGTVVAEARMKSGAMISARLTLENGRELMCMPGLISNPNTEGIYHLLKNGASLITKGEDILEALNWDIETISAKKPDLEGNEKLIYEELSIEGKNMEDLARALNIEINDLMVSLTSMELKGLIKQVGGNYFITS